MDVFEQKVQYDHSHLSLKVYESSVNRAVLGNWHHHKEVEMLAVLDGCIEIQMEDELCTLEKGDVMIIGSFQLHRSRFHASPLKYIVLQTDLRQFLDQSMIVYMKQLLDTHFPLSQINYIFRENPLTRKQVHECITEINQEFRSKLIGHEVAIGILLKKIILLLLRCDRQNLLLPQDNKLQRLRPAMNYVDEHIAEPIKINDVCGLMNLSYSHFERTFKQATGLSFIEYANLQRMRKAELLLLTTDDSVASIAEAVGIANLSAFYKIFGKKNGCSPKRFKRDKAAWHDEAGNDRSKTTETGMVRTAE
jgi:AraC-like DNA-binding protein/mannose-6-phosphate isomerase-like protein (cupin superfamily)